MHISDMSNIIFYNIKVHPAISSSLASAQNSLEVGKIHQVETISRWIKKWKVVRKEDCEYEIAFEFH